MDNNHVSFSYETTKFRCRPERVAKVRATLEKMPKHKPVALSSINLKRQYPAYVAGDTTTADYVNRFNSQFKSYQVPVEYDCENYYKLAPMLNPETPEAIEETDTSYSEPDRPSKPKKRAATATAAQYEYACRKAVGCLMMGDIDGALSTLMEIL